MKQSDWLYIGLGAAVLYYLYTQSATSGPNAESTSELDQSLNTTAQALASQLSAAGGS
jgi:hypothetical protein